MDRENERLIKRIEREIDVEETLSAFWGALFSFLFCLGMFIIWLTFGY